MGFILTGQYAPYTFDKPSLDGQKYWAKFDKSFRDNFPDLDKNDPSDFIFEITETHY